MAGAVSYAGHAGRWYGWSFQGAGGAELIPEKLDCCELATCV